MHHLRKKEIFYLLYLPYSANWLFHLVKEHCPYKVLENPTVSEAKGLIAQTMTWQFSLFDKHVNTYHV